MKHENFIELSVRLQLFKEDDGPNKERMDWIRHYQLERLKGSSNNTNESSHSGRKSNSPSILTNISSGHNLNLKTESSDSQNLSNLHQHLTTNVNSKPSSANNTMNTTLNSYNSSHSSGANHHSVSNTLQTLPAKERNSGNLNLITQNNTCISQSTVQSKQSEILMNDEINKMSNEENKIRRGGHRLAMKRKKLVEHRNHKFYLTFFKQLTFCSVCRGFIWGIHTPQAYQCSLCQASAHEKCIQNILTDCRCMAVNQSQASREAKASASKERFNIDIPHSWKNKTFYKPTFCSHCGQMLIGLVRQGLQCRECDRVAHVKCKDLISNDCGLNALLLMENIKKIQDSKTKSLQ